jgi:hypothetical protein
MFLNVATKNKSFRSQNNAITYVAVADVTAWDMKSHEWSLNCTALSKRKTSTTDYVEISGWYFERNC